MKGAETLLVVAVFGTLIYLGVLQNHQRYDLTREQVFSLSPASIQAVSTLEQETTLLAFYGGADPRVPSLEALAESYRAHNRKFRFELVDPIRHPELAERYRLTPVGPHLLLSFQRSVEGTQEERLIPIKSPDEEAITRALRRSLRRELSTVYFVRGHGELSLEPEAGQESLSPLLVGFDAEGLRAEALELATLREIPEDAAAVVIAGPQRALLDPEVQSLARYLEGGGALFLLADPGRRTGLEALLEGYGLQLGEGTIVETSGLGERLGVGPTVVTVHRYAEHAVTKHFGLYTLFPSVRPLLLLGIPGVDRPTPLALTTAGAFAEKGRSPPYSRDEDELGGELCVLALQEHRPAARAGAPAPRIAVAGDSQWITEPWLSQLGNRDLFLNLLGYLANRAEAVTLRPKRRSASSLFLTRRQGVSMRFISLNGIPLAFAFVGLIAMTLRRRRAARGDDR